MSESPEPTPEPGRSPAHEVPTLDERSARRVLLARAFETQDADGTLITRAERRKASEVAQAGAGSTAEDEAGTQERTLRFLALRAGWLHELLETRFPSVGTTLRIAGSGGLVPALAVPLALALGLAAEEFGPDKHVNLLSTPLLVLLAWNLLVYVALAVGALTHARPRLPAALAHAAAWLAAPERSWIRVRGEAVPAATEAHALRRFLTDWMRLGGALHVERTRLALHLAALAFALGAMGGLYLRGLVFEYRATWESTFLDPEGVHALLSAVLGPAAALSGRSIPDVSAIADMRLPGSTNAAPWIHLYALTTALVIGLPRSLLALASGRRVRRLSRALPIDVERDAGLLRTSAAVRGGGVHVAVLPYSTAPDREAHEALVGLVADLFGGRAHIDLRAPLEYGDDPPEALDADHCVVLFNLAQSPEGEVHARFVESLPNGTERGASASVPLVLIDESALRARFGSDDAGDERLAERRKAWELVLRDVGAEGVAVDLSRPIPDAVLTRAREALTAGGSGRAQR